MKKAKKIVGILSCVLLLIAGGEKSVFAMTPVSLALELEGQKLNKGDSTQVMVSLQNYNEEYKDNVITTMIIEITVDTDKLNVDNDSVTMLFDEGKGMGFGVARLKENKVELQYVNVSDPLAKGTKELLSFNITAKEPVDDVLDALQITRVVLQDGSIEVSEKLVVVPMALVNGEVVELENEVETTAASEENSSVGNSQNGTEDTTTSIKSGTSTPSGTLEETTAKNTHSQNGNDKEGESSGQASANGSQNSGSDEIKESATGDEDDEKNAEDADDSQQSGESNTEKATTGADKDKQEEKNNSGKYILYTVAAIGGAAAGAIFYRKKKAAGNQK